MRIQRRVIDKGRGIAERLMGGLARTRVTPTQLTVTGLMLCLIAAGLVSQVNHSQWFYLAASLSFIVGSLFDVLDGALARAGGKTSLFGGFFDSLADRPAEVAMLLAIQWIFVREGQSWMMLVTGVAVAGSFMVPLTRSAAENRGIHAEVGIGNRLVRCTIISLAIGLNTWRPQPLAWGMVILGILAWVTVIQRVLYVRNQLKAQS